MDEAPTYSERVGTRLREERQRAGMTLAQAAQAAHLHPDSLSRLETGRRNIGLDDFVALAKAYRLPPGALLDQVVLGHAENTAEPEYVEALLDALPPVKAEGWVPSEAMVRQLQLAAVKTLEPIHVRISAATVAVTATTAEGSGTVDAGRG